MQHFNSINCQAWFPSLSVRVRSRHKWSHILCYPLDQFEQLKATWTNSWKASSLNRWSLMCIPYILAAEQFQRLPFLNRLYCFCNLRHLASPFFKTYVLWEIKNLVHTRRWVHQHLRMVSSPGYPWDKCKPVMRRNRLNFLSR